jgi:hypothetical protein
MSLETLSYKYIGKFTAPAATVSGNMSAISTAFSSTTYADGTSRVLGSGVAWTPFAQLSASNTLAVSLTPVTSTLGQKIVYAGGGGGTPTMVSPDTYANTRINFGLCKNAGNFNSWADANPYSAGQFSGYTALSTGTAITAIHAYECKDSVFVIGETSAGGMYFSHAGAIIDPESSNASAAESDGKIYGLFTSGYTAVGGTPNWYNNFGSNSFLSHGATAGQSHAYIMNFGASTTTAVKRSNVLLTSPSAATILKNSVSEFVRLPIYIEIGGSTFYGRLREVFMFGTGLSHTKLTVSSLVSAYILGASTVTTSECIAIKA